MYLVKSFLLAALLSSCAGGIKQLKHTEGIKNPESVYFDAQSEFIFVSNVDGAGDGKDGTGHISKMSKSGKMIDSQWITGLNAPKGMRAHGGKLWVSDINRVIVIDIKTKKIENTIYIKGSKFLNDIAITSKGVVYVSDTIASKIYVINGRIPAVFAKGPHLESPNGLLIYNGELLVASWGLTKDWSTKKSGRLYKMSLKSKKIVSYITEKPLGNLDGLELANDGRFIVSDWVAGKIYKVSLDGNVEEIYKGKKGLADIGYISDSNTILVPYMLTNEIISL